MKPKYLFHGSVRKIDDSELIPRQAKDLGEVSEHLHKAVYATDSEEIAIAMAIISLDGVVCSRLNFDKKPFGIIYEGWPEKDYVYLYKIKSETFRQEGGFGHQYYSTAPVEIVDCSKLKVKDYMYLVRESTDSERNKFFEKYRDKINLG